MTETVSDTTPETDEASPPRLKRDGERDGKSEKHLLPFNAHLGKAEAAAVVVFDGKSEKPLMSAVCAVKAAAVSQQAKDGGTADGVAGIVTGDQMVLHNRDPIIGVMLHNSPRLGKVDAGLRVGVGMTTRKTGPN